MRRNSSPRARLVITSLSGCALCAVACWEGSAAASGQMAAGSRASPGAPLSIQHSLELGGSNKHVPPGKHNSGGASARGRSSSSLFCTSLGSVSSAGLTAQGTVRQSSSWASSASPCQNGSSQGKQVPVTVPKGGGVLWGLLWLPTHACWARRGLSLGQESPLHSLHIVYSILYVFSCLLHTCSFTLKHISRAFMSIR